MKARPVVADMDSIEAIAPQITQFCHTAKISGLRDPGTLVWEMITADFPLPDPNSQFWWRTTGFTLAILLQKAGYAIESQCRNLLFYFFYVVPELGAGPNAEGQPPHWKSFMTDDFTPIELSWSWGCGSEAPMVRFSIEPIGPCAGTSADPLNEHATTRLIRRFQHVLPDTDLTWFDHFSKELLTYSRHSTEPDRISRFEGHESRTFIAFDLDENGIVLKAYFLPAFKAAETGQSNLAVISQAIKNLPNQQGSSFYGYNILLDYMKTSVEGSQLEVEMLGIDCTAPTKSRLKIYLRSRSTCFNSVRATMALGGRLKDPGLEKGFEELRKLWTLVLGKDEQFAPAEDLQRKDHRTAGILYYFEIRPGQAAPVPKVYIPVRHYAPNDLDIAHGLRTYLKSRRQGSVAGRYMQALKSIL